MPVFLIPFLFLAAKNTKDHNKQTEAALMQAQTDRMRYELELKEYQDKHPVKVYKVDPHKKQKN
jgi:hypothetical protein